MKRTGSNPFRKLNLKSLTIVMSCLLVGAMVWFLREGDSEPVWKDRVVSEWMKDLHHDDVLRRDAAESALLEMGETAVPFLIEDLKAQDSIWKSFIARTRSRFPSNFQAWIPNDPPASQLRAHAASVLRHMGTTAAPATPDLIRALLDREESVANLSEYALIQIGEPAAHALTRHLLEDPELVLPGLRILGEMRATNPQSVEVVLHFTRSPDEHRRFTAATALWQMTGREEISTRVFAELLTSGMPELRHKSAQFLGRIGPSAIDAVPDLIRVLNSPEVSLQLAAAESLFQINRNTEQSVPIFRQTLTHPSVNIRWQSAKALGRIAPGAIAAVPELVHALREDPEKVVRIAAAQALGRIGPEAQSAVQPLLDAELDSDDLVRSTAKQSLWRIAPGLFTSQVSE